MRSIFKQRSLLTLGIAETVSGVGAWITMMALFALVVFRGDGGVAQSSGILLAGLLPMLVCSPLAGWLCDRADLRRIMIASELLSALAVAGMIFTTRIELLYVLLAVQAAVGSAMTPARYAALPQLVEPGQITRANAFLQQLASLVKIGAPMLAGLVLAFVDPHTALWLDVLSYLLSAAILSRLPALPPRADSGAQPGAAPAASLVSVLRATPQLRLLLVTMFLIIVTLMGFDVLAPIVTRDTLGGDERMFGLLIGLIGIGSVASSLLLLLRRRARDPWRDVVVALVLVGCFPGALALAGAAPGLAAARLVAVAGCLIGGLGNGLLSIQVATLLQTLPPPALVGRVSGMFQSVIVAAQISTMLLVPLLVPALLTNGQFFGGATAMLALIVALVLVALRAQRRGARPAALGAS